MNYLGFTAALFSETCLFWLPIGQNLLTLFSKWLQDTFGDYQVGLFKQVTLLHSDLIRQVSLLQLCLLLYMPHAMFIANAALVLSLIAPKVAIMINKHLKKPSKTHLFLLGTAAYVPKIYNLNFSTRLYSRALTLSYKENPPLSPLLSFLHLFIIVHNHWEPQIDYYLCMLFNASLYSVPA